MKTQMLVPSEPRFDKVEAKPEGDQSSNHYHQWPGRPEASVTFKRQSSDNFDLVSRTYQLEATEVTVEQHGLGKVQEGEKLKNKSNKERSSEYRLRDKVEQKVKLETL